MKHYIFIKRYIVIFIFSICSGILFIFPNFLKALPNVSVWGAKEIYQISTGFLVGIGVLLVFNFLLVSWFKFLSGKPSDTDMESLLQPIRVATIVQTMIFFVPALIYFTEYHHLFNKGLTNTLLAVALILCGFRIFLIYNVVHRFKGIFASILAVLLLLDCWMVGKWCLETLFMTTS